LLHPLFQTGEGAGESSVAASAARGRPEHVGERLKQDGDGGAFVAAVGAAVAVAAALASLGLLQVRAEGSIIPAKAVSP